MSKWTDNDYQDKHKNGKDTRELQVTEETLNRLAAAADYEQKVSLAATQADMAHIRQTGLLAYECCREIAQIVYLDENLASTFPRWAGQFDKITEDTFSALRDILKQHQRMYGQ